MRESHPRPHLISSEQIYDGRLLHLRVDRVRMPSGRETTREVIDHPGAVVILPTTRDGRIRFVEQYRYAVSEALLELPAGLIDAGESPETAARRELREEVGLVPGSLTQIGVLYPSAGYSNERVFVFHAGDCDEAPRPPLDEGLTIRAMKLDELAAYIDTAPFPFHNAATAFAVLWYIRNNEIMPQHQN
jgi:ADP-ribose pyrophosphatase